MQQLGLSSPKVTPSRGGKELLQPAELNFEQEKETPVKVMAQSKSKNLVHGEVGHSGENYR
jgi:hypothetical protein